MDNILKSEILDFLNSNPLAVISTKSCNSTFPESALIAFDQYDNLNLVFETFSTSRKYQNLLAHPNISIVIGWDIDKHITLQLEGLANKINKADYEQYIQHFLKKDTPCTEKFLRDKRVRFFTIKPTWLRYSDYTGKMPKIYEYKF